MLKSKNYCIPNSNILVGIRMIQTIIISILFLHANQFSTIRILIMNRMERNNIQITKKALPL